ncbi:MAG TPA: hypothetical protein VHD60_02525 [Candidatus Saccharimonadales bacterium]|nr:hypothetical protein [Candidatus Saccharimonadales bacterium]
MADDDIPEIDVKARQQAGKAHVELEVPVRQEGEKEKPSDPNKEDDKKEGSSSQEDEKEKQSSESEQKDEDSGFTIAGYKPGEILKAPLKPPDEKEVGERSPQSD